MQLTGPAFLLFFLPLSVLFLLPFSQKSRPVALSFISALWYVLANRKNPLGIGIVLLLVVLVFLLTRKGRSRVRTAFAVALPLSLWLCLRVLAERGLCDFYPMGLTFVALGAISLAIDTHRERARAPKSLVEVMGYLLFFPVLTLGPVVRWRRFLALCAKMEITTEKLSRGICLYMLGFVKRIAIAATLLDSVTRLLSYSEGPLPFGILCLLLLLSCLQLYFFVWGTLDMARGIALLYGIELSRTMGRFSALRNPASVLLGLCLSVRAFAWDYIAAPLTQRLRGRGRVLLAACAIWAITVLFFTTRLASFLYALPFLVLALCQALCQKRCRFRLWRTVCGALGAAVAVVGLSAFSLSLLVVRPLSLVSMPVGAAAYTHDLSHYLFATTSVAGYLPLALVCACVLLPLSRYGAWLCRKGGARARWLVLFKTVLIFAAFVLSVIYFMPQYPQYADHAYLWLIL